MCYIAYLFTCVCSLLMIYDEQRCSGFMLADAGHDDVSTHAALLRTHADCTMAASIALMHHSFVMMGRASTTVKVSHDLYEELLAVADGLSALLKQIVRARDADTKQSLSKAADDQEAMATLMDAGAAMSEDMHTNVHLVLASLASLDKLALSMDGDGSRLYVPVSTMSSSALVCMSTVWCELPDITMSTVSGRGMQTFAKASAGATRNVVLVYPCVSSGVLAEYVKRDDVCLMLKDDSGSLIDAHVTFKRAEDGGLQLVYVVAADCVSRLTVIVTVCGVPVGPAVTVQLGYDVINGTNHVASYDVGTVFKFGMAVNSNGDMMVVSFDVPLHQVHVFRLAPSFERACVIGRDGTGPAEFNRPLRLCFTDDDTILVCDLDNNRVQQLTGAGEYLSSFAVQGPISIAVRGDMVAIGTVNGPIEIPVHSLATGELIHRFKFCAKRGQIGNCATGIRYTPDGTRLLVAELNNRYLLVFTVEGVFVKRICTGILSKGDKDVSFGAGGEIIVADKDKHRICVFSPDGATLIKIWGSRGTTAGEFQYPNVLAVSGSYLYVMDKTRVQVFQEVRSYDAR